MDLHPPNASHADETAQIIDKADSRQSRFDAISR